MGHRLYGCVAGGDAEAVVGEKKPEDEPEESHGAGREEGGAPSVDCRDVRNEERRDKRGEVGSGVEEASGERSLLRFEPFGDGFDGCGEVSRFAQSEQETGDAEARDREDEDVGHTGECPESDCERIAAFCAELVDDAASAEEADAIGCLKEDKDVGEVVGEYLLVGDVERWVPAHEGEFVQLRLDEREDGAVHIVDGRGHEEEGADEPADVRCFGCLYSGI